MKNVILERLRLHEGSYVSGQEICDCLGVSRTTVWKQIIELREEGYEIDSSPRKGYRLLQSPDRLTASEVIRQLKTRCIGRMIHHFDETNSTNIEAKNLARRGEPEGAIAVAEHQTQGRGRTSRQWFSAPGEAVMFSLILRPALPPSRAASITQIGAAAVSLALDSFGLESRIKWPNDVLVNGRKICGILTEMTCELDRIDFIVMGIGINVNTVSYPPDVADVATSIRIETGSAASRIEVLARVLNEFEPLYDDYLRGGAAYLDICRDRSALIGQWISYETPEGRAGGTVTGLDSEGRLLLRDKNGETVSLLSGEVHIGTSRLLKS